LRTSGANIAISSAPQVQMAEFTYLHTRATVEGIRAELV
jgi:hypothetical protein